MLIFKNYVKHNSVYKTVTIKLFLECIKFPQYLKIQLGIIIVRI